MKEFAALLRERRETAGLSRSKLATLAGVSQPYISQIENGQRGEPTERYKRKLAAVLGADMAACPHCGKTSFPPLMQTIEISLTADAINELRRRLQGLVEHTDDDAGQTDIYDYLLEGKADESDIS